MRSKLKVLLFSIIGIVLLVQFTNCAEVGSGSSELNSGLCDPSGLCTGTQQDSLSITISPNTTISHYGEPVREIAVSGDCSTGNFSNNKIELSYLNSRISNYEKRSFFDACVNGKFYIQLYLGGLILSPEDSVVVKAQLYGLSGSKEIMSSRTPSEREFKVQ